MSSVYDRLAKIIMDVMHLEEHEIQPTLTFNDLEVDSLGLVELILVAQKEYGISIADDDLHANLTLEQAAAVLETKVVPAR
jgi:acyl carrier protein